MTLRLLIVIGLLLAMGRPSSSATAAHRAPAHAWAAGAAVARDSLDVDTGAVVATGPVLVAAFITTQAQVDSDPDVGEALSDFQYYLPLVADSLTRLGVHVAIRYARPVRVVLQGRSIVWSVPDDSGGVGYLLLAPPKPPQTIWGIQSDVGLLAAAEEYFWPRKRQREDPP